LARDPSLVVFFLSGTPFSIFLLTSPSSFPFLHYDIGKKLCKIPPSSPPSGTEASGDNLSDDKEKSRPQIAIRQGSLKAEGFPVFFLPIRIQEASTLDIDQRHQGLEETTFPIFLSPLRSPSLPSSAKSRNPVPASETDLLLDGRPPVLLFNFSPFRSCPFFADTQRSPYGLPLRFLPFPLSFRQSSSKTKRLMMTNPTFPIEVFVVGSSRRLRSPPFAEWHRSGGFLLHGSRVHVFFPHISFLIYIRGF